MILTRILLIYSNIKFESRGDVRNISNKIIKLKTISNKIVN